MQRNWLDVARLMVRAVVMLLLLAEYVAGIPVGVWS